MPSALVDLIRASLKIRDEYRQVQWAAAIQECRASAIVYSLVESAKANGVEPFAYLQRVLVELPYLGKSPSHEELEAFMPWAPGIQKDCKMPNSDAYVNTYLE